MTEVLGQMKTLQFCENRGKETEAKKDINKGKG